MRNNRKRLDGNKVSFPFITLGSGPRMGGKRGSLEFTRTCNILLLEANLRGQHNHPHLPREKLRLPKNTCCLRPALWRQRGPAPSPCARPLWAQVTWVVAAAPRGAPPPPGAVVEGGVPFAEPPALEGIGSQVADLQAGKLTHEVSE